METITFGRWVRYLTREWRHPKDYDTEIAFAIRMATFTPNGGRVYVAAPVLAELAGIDERTARRRRQACVRLGMFRATGDYHVIPGRGKIEELELALPPHLPGRADPTGGGRADLTGKERDVNRETSKESDVDGRAESPYRSSAVTNVASRSSSDGNSLADGSERSERRVITAELADILCPLGCGEVNYPGHDYECQRNPWSDRPAGPWSGCRRICEMCNPTKPGLTGKVPEPAHALCRGRCHPKRAA